MNGYDGTTAVGMTQEVVAAFDPNNVKSHLSKGFDEL
jgi:hypothetical protein